MDWRHIWWPLALVLYPRHWRAIDDLVEAARLQTESNKLLLRVCEELDSRLRQLEKEAEDAKAND